MVRIKSIPGIMWASDILTGQRSIPVLRVHKDGKDQGFKELFDEEMERLGHEKEHGRPDR